MHTSYPVTFFEKENERFLILVQNDYFRELQTIFQIKVVPSRKYFSYLCIYASQNNDKPNMEKMTKPAKIDVAELAMAIKTASL